MVDDIEGIESSGLAQAYARARGADRMSSFGDMIALSHEVDVSLGHKLCVVSRNSNIKAGAYSKNHQPRSV